MEGCRELCAGLVTESSSYCVQLAEQNDTEGPTDKLTELAQE